ncbi:Oidioi.mRNA.OKI2018_I69.XSR.g16031.t1.cds [Oikopleura dioica]|uniref:Oidioi.mRNA.OKI2018_I69.XSR.g16031.t1.cds n=1 Tax=Oikopleura dioica TaxID=34765 RepID=A0ABN7SER2_OIKDI|nr:Oidioi.mRNA.OKI2018_I69.XSR.g16031.t1.cds [Oikopleura dioica]
MVRERTCPRCKTTSYRNPSMKLMVNNCGHSLCESCVNLQYARGQAPCYDCGVNLKRSSFRVQLFDDPMIDREVHLRKKVLKVYNRRAEEFSSEFDYNNYLEEIEDIIIGLMENKPCALDALEKYKRDNQSDIKRNSAKRPWARSFTHLRCFK